MTNRFVTSLELSKEVKKIMGKGIMGTSREKYWSELDDSGKIERLREYVQRVESLIERIGELEYKFQNHKHVDGEIVLPIRSSRMEVERGNNRRGCYGCKICQDQVRI